ncbi:PrsW family intramembrane metalloprotease [Georgenia sp. Z1344]|uniref:PrsW family intramembrane metalloprotease n=1 Tax=Georgenia sp. Z1344 TaxID=3416706 RepID=UPI003CEB9F17
MSQHMGIAPGPGSYGPPPAAWPVPRRRSRAFTVTEIVAVAIAVGGLAWILPRLVGGASGPGQILVAVALAIVPFVAILLLVRWIDAWEPEPRGLLIVAVAWGAGVATAVAATGNSLFQVVVAEDQGLERAAALTAVVSAPLTEESMKGLGLVVVVLLGRGQFHGLVDGVVYSLAVGSGFAAVENIQSFLTYWDSITAVFVQRGLMTPFAHPMFTVCMGLALGIASQSDRPGRWLLVIPGWIASVVLHGLWNYTSVSGSFFQVFVSFQIPLFGAFIALVLWLRHRERRAIESGLRDYAAAGWFAPFEVQMLTSTGARKNAVRWAGGRGNPQRSAMIDFQQAAVELALGRRRARAGRQGRDHQAKESALLRRAVADRAVFLRG